MNDNDKIKTIPLSYKDPMLMPKEETSVAKKNKKRVVKYFHQVILLEKSNELANLKRYIRELLSDINISYVHYVKIQIHKLELSTDGTHITYDIWIVANNKLILNYIKDIRVLKSQYPKNKEEATIQLVRGNCIKLHKLLFLAFTTVKTTTLED